MSSKIRGLTFARTIAECGFQRRGLSPVGSSKVRHPVILCDTCRGRRARCEAAPPRDQNASSNTAMLAPPAANDFFRRASRLVERVILEGFNTTREIARGAARPQIVVELVKLAR